MAPRYGQRQAATAIVAALLFIAGPASADDPSLSDDFNLMMRWLSHEMAQGLAFNAGSSFDPPREVVDRRLQPDISLGAGKMPLDKTKFPNLENPSLNEVGVANVFPSSVLFPNFAMHVRAGLPGRSDFALRFADMTTPPGYKISPTTTGQGQSNSFGLTLRKHVLGGHLPLISFGAHYNHVYGRFKYQTKFNVNSVPGLTADANVEGGIHWNVNSFGLNAVMSHNYGMLTPFFGVGYNYTTGSVRARLQAVPNTFLIQVINGEASERPEQSQARLIMGAQLNRTWANFFANGEIKAIGIGAGKTWIVHAGMSLPFHIGGGGGKNTKLAAREDVRDLRDAVADKPKAKPRRRKPAAPRKEIFGGPVNTIRDLEPAVSDSALIFIQ